QIAVAPGKLALKQSRRVLEQVTRLLDELRSPKPDESPEARHNLSTLQTLSKPVEEVTFSNLPFDQVLDWISQYTGLTIHVQWSRVVVTGVNRDKPVTTLIKQKPMSQILRSILKDVGRDRAKLDFTVQDGVVRIMVASELPRLFSTRVFQLDRSQADTDGRY